MAGESYTNIITARSIPWRKITSLHAAMGARAIFLPIVCSSGVPFPLFKDNVYSAQTIDRIIAVELNLGGLAGPCIWTVTETGTGWTRTINADGKAGSYGFNVTTLDDGADLSLTVNQNITPAMLCSAVLYNFEIPQYQIGHT